MYFLFAFVVATFLALILTPVLTRVADRLGIIDIPTVRKVHSQPIPRCGGIAIAFATLIPVLMWTAIDAQTLVCMMAAGIVLTVGLCDDVYSVPYGWRLCGQLMAAVLIMKAGIVLHHLPFFGIDRTPDFISYPITALFLVGVTNAVNFSDGLDGLAGSCMVLTLSAIALLGYQSGADVLTLRALAIIGATFGFLWYNTHPASVFMGDAGSNWLGFTVGVLCVLLLEQRGTALNPAITALLIGLPLLDLLAVIAQRLASGHSPFKADRRHLHHKILDLDICHYHAVALIYLVQALMIASALVLRYCSDTVLIGAYACIAVLVLALVRDLRQSGWRWPTGAAETFVAKFFGPRWWVGIPCFAILISGLALFLLGTLAPVRIS